MAISIKQPAALCEKGMREINEDYIYPQLGQIDETQRFFIVCDGMGGVGKGDVASKMVANHMANFLSSLSWGSSPSEGQLKQGLESAEEALSAYMQMNPSAIGMGTTLSLVYLGDNEVTLAWVGNSPIFYFRRRNFSLTRAEEISPDGPYRTSPPPYLSEIPPIIYGKESPADLNIRRIPLSEVQEGDYFFLSSDGIMEQVDQRVLATILRTGQSPEFLVTEIENLSKGLTQDDFSCILVQIDRVKDGASFAPISQPNPVESLAIESPVVEEQTAQVIEEPSPVLAQEEGSVSEIKEEESEELDPELKEGYVPAHSPFATQMFYMVLGACALLALIGVTLEGLGVGSKAGKNYDLYVENGKELIDAKDFDRAVEVLDSAVNFAPDMATKIRATELKKTAVQKMEAFNLMNSMSYDDLIQAGSNKFMQNEWGEAIEYYTRAQELALRDSLEFRNDARENLILAYFKYAELYDQGESADPKRSLELYREGLAIVPTDDIKRDPTYQRAMNRVAELSNSIDTGNDGQLADNSSQKDPFQDVSPESPESPNNTTIDPNPTNRVSDNSTGKVERSSNKGSRNQHLIEGKAFFTSAKTNNSKSKYRESISALENAGSSLDGIGAYLLSVMYHEGRGGTKNEDKALKYAQTSAQKGYSQGHFYYAHLLLLRERRGDTLTALKSLRIAAQDEHLPAINRLNKMGLF